jgi:hypothetical protein
METSFEAPEGVLRVGAGAAAQAAATSSNGRIVRKPFMPFIVGPEWHFHQ